MLNLYYFIIHSIFIRSSYQDKGGHAFSHSIKSFNDCALRWQRRKCLTFDIWKKVLCEEHHGIMPKICLGTSGRKRTVLVTGGSGFLGQHIVKHLEEGTKYVEEIRVFDTSPYKNNLGESCINTLLVTS